MQNAPKCQAAESKTSKAYRLYQPGTNCKALSQRAQGRALPENRLKILYNVGTLI